MSPPLDPRLFAFGDEVLWVMHCADGPSPTAAVDAARAMLERESRPWNLRFRADVRDLPAEARHQAARVLGADSADIALAPTTSSGLVSVARGMRWQRGDRIYLPEGEFPSNIWPWLALRKWGVTTTMAALWPGHRAGAEAWSSPPPTADSTSRLEDRLLEALDCEPMTTGDGTKDHAPMHGGPRRWLAASWVRFQDGLVLDLGRMARGCRERGVELVVDGIQGAGTALPDLDGVSAFASGGHKGLLGPHGMGILWTSAELRTRMAPTGSWLSVDGAYDFRRPNTDLDRRWLRTGESLEQGTPNLVGIALFRTSLEILANAGPDRIAAHIAELRGLLIDGLARLPSWGREAERLAALDRARRLGPILALHHEGAGITRLEALARSGYGSGIYSTVREGYLRIALHGWHTENDIARLLDWLATDRL